MRLRAKTDEKNGEFWEACLAVADDEYRRARSAEDGRDSVRTHGVHDEVHAKMEELLQVRMLVLVLVLLLLLLVVLLLLLPLPLLLVVVLPLLLIPLPPQGKASDELLEMEQAARAQIEGGGAVDVEYWEVSFTELAQLSTATCNAHSSPPQTDLLTSLDPFR